MAISISNALVCIFYLHMLAKCGPTTSSQGES